jgi:hypothetical protein
MISACLSVSSDMIAPKSCDDCVLDLLFSIGRCNWRL